MKRFAGWLLFFWGCICCICASEISITDSWKYKAENDERFSSMDWNDSDWVTVDLPHTWNAGDVIDEQRGYRRGISWYRKKLFIPSEARDKKITLRFDGVASKADVYLNGKLLKTHLGAYTAFGVDITDICEVGKENLLAVKVDNSSSLGEILPPVSGDFSIFGGIYRRVFLQWTEKVHFVTEPYAAVPVRIQTPEVSVSEASIQIVAFLKNDFTDTKHVHVNVFLCDEMNRIVKEKQLKLKLIPGRKYPISTSVGRIENPHLWSPELPYLYTVKVQVCDAKNGEMYQEVISPVGFRWFSVDKTGFYLNGKYLKLRGAARHQDYAGLGTAIPVEMNRRDMRLLKEMGANFVRISHYPQDPEIYRACDELGLIVWSEICVVNEVRKNTEFAHNCKEMLKEMILQNYNHPSVVLWGAMNELWDYHKQAIALARELEALKKELDPYRLSCVAFHAFTWEKPYTQSSKEMFSISDVNGVNVYESWYQGDSATIAPMFDKFCSYSTAKPRFLSEFGAGSDERIHSYTPRTFDFTPEFQLDFNRRYINEMEKRPDYIGYSIWNLVDFQVDGRGDSKPNLNQKGMLTEDRRKKEIYYYCQARWSDIPMIHIAGADWTKRVEICDDSINVHKISVFSNQKTAELIHNGKSLGVREVVNGEAVFAVPFIDGENLLDARSGALSDRLKIQMRLLSSRLTDSDVLLDGLCINLGQEHCYFIDPQLQEIWIPDKPYTKGSWGYMDGKPFNSWPGSSHDGVRYGVGADIKNTFLEPLFQTFLIGTTCYRLDVPDGVYEIGFYFTEPFSKDERKNIVRTGVSAEGQRVFDVSVNGEKLIESLNLADSYGEQTAVVKTLVVNVRNHEGLEILLSPQKGQGVISGLKVKKIR